MFRTITRNIGWIMLALVILYGSWLMLRLTIPYAAFERYTDFLRTKQRVYHLVHWRASFYVHVFVSTVVLVAGLFQFSKWLMLNRPAIHRTLGKIYILVILFFSAPAGLIMGFYANGGIVGRISFVLLSVLWFAFTLLGWIYAKKRRWDLHLTWMMRSYALTLSALTLRFFTLIIGVMHFNITPFKAYVIVAWTSWTINLLLAELFFKKILIKRMLGTTG